MLTTGQENAVRSWVELAILGCPELAPIPLAKIVWSEQDFPEDARPYALIRYSGSTEEGATPSQIVNGSDELETTTHDETTVSITIVTKPSDAAPTREQVASSYTRELRARSRSFVAGILSQAKLAVRRVDVVPDVARLQGKSQWESRAVIDLTLGHALVITETPGVINQAEISGTTEPPTPTRLYLVG
jgi:hypothetical protein